MEYIEIKREINALMVYDAMLIVKCRIYWLTMISLKLKLQLVVAVERFVDVTLIDSIADVLISGRFGICTNSSDGITIKR